MRTPLRSSRGLVLVAASLLAAGLGVATASVAQAQDPEPWELVELTPLDGADTSVVYDINTAGWAVGHSDERPTLWDPDGDPIALSLPEGATGEAMALTDWGLVVGTITPAGDDPPEAVAWFAGTRIPLTDGMAMGVNEGAAVVGCTASGEPFAMLVGGEVHELPTPHGGCATVINDWGAIGGVRFTTEEQDAVTGALWYEGDEVAVPSSLVIETFLAVTDRPIALVQRHPSGGATHAAMLVDGANIVLDPDAHETIGGDVNEHGIAVGTLQEEADGPTEAVLWVYGETIALADLAGEEAAEAVAAGAPSTISDHHAIGGNTEGGTAWVLRPPSNG